MKIKLLIATVSFIPTLLMAQQAPVITPININNIVFNSNNSGNSTSGSATNDNAVRKSSPNTPPAKAPPLTTNAPVNNSMPATYGAPGNVGVPPKYLGGGCFVGMPCANKPSH